MVELIPFMLVVFYIAPFCIAAGRAHESAVAIFVVNVFFGWTIIGWFAALFWALFGASETPASRARNARPYAKQLSPASGKAPMPRILHNFTD